MIRLPLLAALLFVASLPSTVAAAEGKGGIARVMLASPTTTFAGKSVAENQLLLTVGTLKTGTEGGAKVKLNGNDVIVELAANSEINLVLPPSGDPSDSIELIKGKIRVRVPRAKSVAKGDPKTDKPRFLLRHRKVTMGVRGTDFFAIANDDLGETELVVFQGEVEFTNETTTETQKVDAGYWSAIGGRYGDKVRTPMKLSASGVGYFDHLSHDTPSFTLQAAPTEKASEAPQTSTPGH